MELGPVLTLAGVLGTALITAAVTFYTTRSKAKGDLQASLIAGFGAITDQLQEERKELQDIVRNLTKDIESLRDQLNRKNEVIEGMKIDEHYTRMYIQQLEFLMQNQSLPLPIRQVRVKIIEAKSDE